MQYFIDISSQAVIVIWQHQNVVAHIYILYAMLLFINECTSASTLTLFIRILTFVFRQIRFDIILYFFYRYNIESLLMMFYDTQILINIFI